MNLKQISQCLSEKRQAHSEAPVVIAVAGGSGSGKTWLAEFINQGLGASAQVFSMDCYYQDRSQLSDEEVLKVNFDHPEALDEELMVQDLEQLISGESVIPPSYDYATHARSPGKVVRESAPFLIVEGIFALHYEKLQSLYDLSIFVDVDADERLLRRLRRDTLHRRIPLEETLRLYSDFVRPMHETFVKPSAVRADVIWRAELDASFPEDLLQVLLGAQGN